MQPHIGGDLALLTGIAKRIVEMGAIDDAFLERPLRRLAERCASALRVALVGRDLRRSRASSRDEIDEIARRYAAAKNVVFSWTMGITHHAHGVENVQAIANLALLRGMVGRPRAGLLPIRGHSNVQGIGSVGVTPQAERRGLRAPANALRRASCRPTPGLDTMACIDAAAAGKLKFGFCLGGNLYGSNPDATFAAAAMRKLDMLVYLNTTLNTGHAHGLAKETIILPVLARDEEPQPTTQESMFNYVRFSDGGPARHAGPRSEVEIVAELGRRVAGQRAGPSIGDRWLKPARFARRSARSSPAGRKLARSTARSRNSRSPAGGCHEPQFPTADGQGPTARARAARAGRRRQGSCG